MKFSTLLAIGLLGLAGYNGYGLVTTEDDIQKMDYIIIAAEVLIGLGAGGYSLLQHIIGLATKGTPVPVAPAPVAPAPAPLVQPSPTKPPYTNDNYGPMVEVYEKILEMASKNANSSTVMRANQILIQDFLDRQQGQSPSPPIVES